MNKLAVCIYAVAGLLTVSASSLGSSWDSYSDSDLGCGGGHGHVEQVQQAVVVQSSGCGGNGGGWGNAGGAGGWAGGAGLVGGAGLADGAAVGSGQTIVRQLKPIVVPGKKARIIEHHSRPIYIKPTVTRFVVPGAPVVIKPVLIHKPSCVSIQPKLLTAPAPSQSFSPVLMRVIKNIEQPSQQRTLIVENRAPQSSCNIETSSVGYSSGGGAGLGGGCGGAGAALALGGCSCGGH